MPNFPTVTQNCTYKKIKVKGNAPGHPLQQVYSYADPTISTRVSQILSPRLFPCSTRSDKFLHTSFAAYISFSALLFSFKKLNILGFFVLLIYKCPVLNCFVSNFDIRKSTDFHIDLFEICMRRFDRFLFDLRLL